MRIKFHRAGSSTGHDTASWPVLLLLLVVVLAPTACLLWFMHKAMQNERFAVQQKLVEAYRGHLSAVQARLGRYWDTHVQGLDELAEGASGSATFAQAIHSGWADGLVCFDNRGQIVYPNAALADKLESPDPAWSKAVQLEHYDRDLLAAADEYATVARQATNANLAARALQAQARCLAQSNHKTEAVKILTETMADPRYAQATDSQGRLIVLNGELMALELMENAGASRPTLDRLKQQVMDYANPLLSSSQRRFLMRELKLLFPGDVNFATAEAVVWD